MRLLRFIVTRVNAWCDANEDRHCGEVLAERRQAERRIEDRRQG